MITFDMFTADIIRRAYHEGGMLSAVEVLCQRVSLITDPYQAVLLVRRVMELPDAGGLAGRAGHTPLPEPEHLDDEQQAWIHRAVEQARIKATPEILCQLTQSVAASMALFRQAQATRSTCRKKHDALRRLWLLAQEASRRVPAHGRTHNRR